MTYSEALIPLMNRESPATDTTPPFPLITLESADLAAERDHVVTPSGYGPDGTVAPEDDLYDTPNAGELAAAEGIEEPISDADQSDHADIAGEWSLMGP